MSKDWYMDNAELPLKFFRLLKPSCRFLIPVCQFFIGCRGSYVRFKMPGSPCRRVRSFTYKGSSKVQSRGQGSKHCPAPASHICPLVSLWSLGNVLEAEWRPDGWDTLSLDVGRRLVKPQGIWHPSDCWRKVPATTNGLSLLLQGS